jgi:hypothetical protein
MLVGGLGVLLLVGFCRDGSGEWLTNIKDR